MITWNNHVYSPFKILKYNSIKVICEVSSGINLKELLVWVEQNRWEYIYIYI